MRLPENGPPRKSTNPAICCRKEAPGAPGTAIASVPPARPSLRSTTARALAGNRGVSELSGGMPDAQGFQFVWCDSFALDKGCRVSSQLGKWVGNDYVETDAHEVSGKQVFEKEVWSDFTPNSFSQTLYTGDASDKLKSFLTIKAKRIIKRQP